MDDTPPEVRHCKRCERDLPLTSDYFGKQAGAPNGFRYWCRKCVNEAQKAREQRNTQANRARDAGIDPERWPSAAQAITDESWDDEAPCVGENIPTPVVPVGFEVSSVTSEVDADGTVSKQHIGARPERAADAPVIPPVPVGHFMKGVSTLTDANGKVVLQWQKTSKEQDDRFLWLDAIRTECAAAREYLAPTPPPEYANEDLLACFPVGDPHVGLLGWHEDAGENFDMSIAEENLVGAFQHLTALAPAAAQALLVFIGDNTHVDGQNNTTTAGTRQDADGRTMKMARTIVRICRRAIDIALAKHGRVHMIVERGNHDELISAMLAFALSLLYENETRVTIDTSPEMYHWFRFGKNLIGTHHGDKAKPEQLMGVMAVDRAHEWGACQHRRFYCGHYHHQIVKEVPGVIVEYLPTLAGSDAWHRSMGYRSARAMYMDVFHREWGHINRHVVGIQQLRALPRVATKAS